MEQPKQPSSTDNNKTYAFLATFLGIIGFVIAILAWKDNQYVMFYAKQSLVISMISILVAATNAFIDFIPFFGWIIGSGLSLLVFVAWIMSWVYAISGEKKEVPVIGDIAKKVNL